MVVLVFYTMLGVSGRVKGFIGELMLRIREVIGWRLNQIYTLP
jgi:hypothetical protein